MALNNRLYGNLLTSIKFYFSHQHVRNLPRWSHRRPLQVISPEDYDQVTDKKKPAVPEITEELMNKTISKEKINWKRPKPQVSPEKNQPLEFAIKSHSTKPLTIRKSNEGKYKSADMLETVIDQDGNFIYTKMDDNDVRIGNIMVEVKSKKEKEKKDLMLLEGKRLIKEALDANCKLEYLLFSRLKDVEYLRPSLPKIGAQLYKMPYREMQMWSDLTTNPGIMGKLLYSYIICTI